MKPIVRLLAVLPLLAATVFVSPAALAVDSGDIVVVGTKGEVHFTVNGAARNLRAGGVLEPPATLRTGRDGSVELKQGATTVSVGPDTLLEFPALEKPGAPIDRVLQPRGNAFYDIGKREGRKLRIETPYLVGVVKGTQFNVAAQDGATTISLFEGLLEVRAIDEGAVVDLKAGEIASRKRGDKSISVTKMEAGKAPATSPPAPSGSGSNNGVSPTPPRTPPAGSGAGTRHVGNDSAVLPGLPDIVDTLNGSVAAAGVSVAAGVSEGVNANAAVDVATETSISAGPVSVDTGAGVSLGGSGVDVGANASVNAAPTSVDTGVSVDVGTSGVDVSTGTRVDASPVSVDTGASLNVGGAGVDLSTTTTVDAGPIAADLGTTTTVDPGSGSIDTGVIVGASAPGVTVDVGTSVAADVVAGTVAVGLGVDLGLDDTVTTPDTSTPGTDTGTDTGNTNTVVDVGGLLDGLLRRPGRK